MTKVSDFQPLTVVTKSSILDYAIVLDMPLSTIHTFPIDMKQNLFLTSNYISAFYVLQVALLSKIGSSFRRHYFRGNKQNPL